MKTLETFKKRNTQDLMNNSKNQTLPKNRNFVHEEHEVFLKLSIEVLGHGESQASSFLKWTKEKEWRSLPSGVFTTFWKRRRK